MIRVHSELCCDCARRMQDEIKASTFERRKQEDVPLCYPCRTDQELAARVAGLLGTFTFGAKASASKMIETWLGGMR